MRIGNLNLTARVLGAPLAGVSNRPFRVLAYTAGAAMTYSEMVCSEAIVRYQDTAPSTMEFEFSGK